MTPSLQILQGKYKNRKIKLPEKIHGHNEVTSQKIKESVFQIIRNLHDAPENAFFVDCFCGSCQMGLEAVSRGYAGSLFLDINSERLSNGRSWAEKYLDQADFARCRFDKKDSLRGVINTAPEILQYANSLSTRIDTLVFFADPPYGTPYKNRNTLDILYDQFLTTPLMPGIDIILLIQTNKKNMWDSVFKDGFLPENQICSFFKIYEYGNNRIIALKK